MLRQQMVLNIRSKRNPSSTKIGSIPKGTIIKVGITLCIKIILLLKKALYGVLYILNMVMDLFVWIMLTQQLQHQLQLKQLLQLKQKVNYKVKVTVDSLNIRKGAGTGYAN